MTQALLTRHGPQQEVFTRGVRGMNYRPSKLKSCESATQEILKIFTEKIKLAYISLAGLTWHFFGDFRKVLSRFYPLTYSIIFMKLEKGIILCAKNEKG